MKLLKFVFLVLISANSFAQTSGSGCRVEDKVYTTYLGNASPYHPSNPSKKFYSPNVYIPIYYGSGHNQYQGYRCGYINIYPASSYWNGSQNVPIPEENEITSTVTGGCVISSSLGGSVIREGDYVTYTYNKPGKCGPPAELPLDDYIWVALLAAAGLGFFLMRKHGIA